MSRGKYGAKAANRLAQLDSEIVRGLRSEIDGVKCRNAELEAALAENAARFGGDVIKRADSLAAELIEQARADTEQARRDCDQRLREVADWLVLYFAEAYRVNPDAKVVPDDIDKVLARLVGSANVGQYLAQMPAFGSNRRHRRASAKVINGNRSDYDRPSYAQGVPNQGYLGSAK
ncbi:Uncharacterised protein [Mycobacteroides abscessus subsp. massiliense]|uniref:hypothetical protein n=1 Tax=Mycobacteroides abscessus TaxID=36809 RepID=UPI0009A826F4|nr:hypothetical protein [Mycobacteroides abscessus]SLI18312.1 Uncharacterised protein [Mycobacteroides abscessus subsp. massiliense]SLJ00251.1 Uncharacterised protein [Mycobacteroides abscessus subsp. massiliense]